MKRKIFAIFILLASLSVYNPVNSQTTVFYEDFEGALLQVTSSSVNGSANWGVSSNFFVSPTKSDTARVSNADTLYLTTSSFSTIGNSFVQLEFDHICKVDFFDVAQIEVSTNGGVSWSILNSTQYLGSSPNFGTFGNKFSEGSYQVLWQATNPSATPQNSWFVHEIFDISTVAANQASVMVRFKLGDGGPAGPNGRFGWIIDNIKVVAAPCELTPPTITQQSPVISGLTYTPGPYTLNATITDASGIDTAILYYQINGGPWMSVGMTNTGGNNYQGAIPAVNNNDTVCYYFYAEDAAAPCNNPAQYPNSGCIQFVYTMGLVPPFFTNFESNNGNFIDSAATPGTQWQWGVPGGAVLNSAYSPTKAWGTNLNSQYSSNANCYLISPVFDFTGVSNAVLKFYRAYKTENGWDGFNVEYTTDNVNWQLLGSVGDPNATNWYNLTSVNALGSAGWSGTSQTSWTLSTYNLSFLNNTPGPIRFRFRFAADGSIQDEGVLIDNFEIFVPQPNDVGVTAITSPSGPKIQGTNQTVKITVKNFGPTSVDTIPVHYKINNSPPVVDTLFGPLASNSSANFTFSVPFVVPAGTVNICAYTALSGDPYNFNDTVCTNNTFGLKKDTVTKFDDFETDTLWYAVSNDNQTKWELGTPNYGSTNSAYSPVNAWDINLNSSYGPNALAYLYTQFYDLTNSQQTRIKFKMNYNTQLNFDGVRLEYSLDTGQTWATLGVVNDPLGVNWYNSTISGQPGWSGSSGGWKHHERLSTNLDGNPSVIFRFVFISNASTQIDGVSVDDFEVFSPLQKDLKVDQIIKPVTGCVLSSNEEVKILVKNVGLDTIYNYNVAYSVNNGPAIVEPVNTPIAPNNTYIHTFATNANLQAFGNYTIKTWVSSPLDMNVNNDTLTKVVKNIDGCEFVVKLVMNNSIDPNGYWNVVDSATGQIIKQIYFQGNYSSNQVVYDTICAADGQTIAFNLVNSSTIYNVSHQVLGYDTVYLQGTGTTSNAYFKNTCPPLNSTASTKLVPVGMTLPLPQPYKFRLHYINDGIAEILTMYVALEIDGIIQEIDTINYGAPGLGYKIPQYHIFDYNWNATPGCHTIRAWTYLPNDTLDTEPTKDTIVRQVCIIDSTSNFPYCNDFEGSMNPWVSLHYQNFTDNTSWKLGDPNKPVLMDPYNGNNCWYTSDSTYWPFEKSALYSPLFTVDSGCYKLSFYHQYKIMDIISDGVVVDYTINKGSSWSALGQSGDTVNWYNKANVPGLSTYVPGVGSIPSPGWNGNSQGWKYSSHYIKFNNDTNVLFRFRIGSDFDNHDEGWAIDQVCFEKVFPCNLGVGIQEITVAGLELGQNYPNPASDITTIQFSLPYNGEYAFAIYNMMGQSLYEESGNKAGGVYKVEINVNEFPKGVYFYSLRFEDRILVKKMIIE